MEKLWQKLRERISPKRIYKYGTVGLVVYDDRTKVEKICDMVDNYFFDIRQMRRYIPANKDKVKFKPFRDISTGEWISSAGDIDKICKKKGLEYLRFDEIDRESGRYHKMNQAKFRKESKERLAGMIKELGQGKSYVKEINKKIREGKYEIGKKDTMN